MDLLRATDAELLRAAQHSGEPFGEFYRRYEEPVLLFMVRRTKRAELAADLTAEVFTSALASVGRYRETVAPPAAWLFSIARHTLAKSYRRAKVVERARQKLGPPVLVIDDEAVAAIERLDQNGLGEEALERLAALPMEQRQAIEEHVLGERDYDEIAAELECSSNVVRQRVSRGLASLRAQMEPMQ